MVEVCPVGNAKLQHAAFAMSLVQGSVADIGPPSQLEELLQHRELFKSTSAQCQQHARLSRTGCMLCLTLRSSLSTSGYLLSTKKLLRCSTSLTLPQLLVLFRMKSLMSLDSCTCVHKDGRSHAEGWINAQRHNACTAGLGTLR